MRRTVLLDPTSHQGSETINGDLTVNGNLSVTGSGTFGSTIQGTTITLVGTITTGGFLPSADNSKDIGAHTSRISSTYTTSIQDLTAVNNTSGGTWASSAALRIDNILSNSDNQNYLSRNSGSSFALGNDSAWTVIQIGNTSPRMALGGTTSSFPALKRNSTAIDFRLADDSAYAPINTAAATINGALTVSTGTVTLPGGTPFVFNSALTNGAAAQVGTLTNAPAAGNPTKWFPINDNGTTRYIPAW